MADQDKNDIEIIVFVAHCIFYLKNFLKSMKFENYYFIMLKISFPFFDKNVRNVTIQKNYTIKDD